MYFMYRLKFACMVRETITILNSNFCDFCFGKCCSHRFNDNVFLNNGNICCGYSLEAPRRGASNEYPQYIFSCRNNKNINIFCLKKKCPIWNYDKCIDDMEI